MIRTLTLLHHISTSLQVLPQFITIHVLEMYTLNLLAMALASVSLANSAALTPRIVQDDEVIAVGYGGRYEVIKASDWEAELARTNITIGRPDSILDHPENLPSLYDVTTVHEDTNSNTIEKRGCGSDKIFARNKDQDFLDWDIAMSSVIGAGGDVNNIAASSGVTIGNSVTVTRSVDIGIIKDYISATVSTAFERSFTSQVTTQYTLGIPKGYKYGVMVSNPRTYRRSGFLRKGCIGSQTSTYFQADEHFSGQYGGLSWVQGVIKICASNKYPVQFCVGSGVHR